jgi:hypothetical protein
MKADGDGEPEIQTPLDVNGPAAGRILMVSQDFGRAGRMGHNWISKDDHSFLRNIE